MQKYVKFIFVLLIVACIAACGGSGSSTKVAAPIYNLPAALAPASAVMGGAVQSGAISAKFTNYSVSTPFGVAGKAGFGNYSTTNGPPPMFYRPTDITTNGTDYYVADYGNYAIRKVTPSTGIVTTLINQLSGIMPFSLTLKADGSQLYVVDAGSNTIRVIAISTDAGTGITTGVVAATIGSSTGEVGSVDSTDPTLARFNRPTGITTDGDNLYVTDSGNSTIRRIDLNNGYAVSTLAGTSGAVGSDDGLPKIARFSLPQSITTDRTSLFVTDFNNRTIRRIDILTGTVSTLAGYTGSLGADVGSLDGVGAAARFNRPYGITTDGTNLYVTDLHQNTIRRIVISSGAVTTISGTPKLKDGDDGTLIGEGGSVDSPGAPSFYNPMGITTDGTSLFVADNINHTIRKIK